MNGARLLRFFFSCFCPDFYYHYILNEVFYNFSWTMHLNIAFSGPAGSGINTAWELLSELLAKKWYCVRVDKEYASVIKWSNNTMFVNISNNWKPYSSRKIQTFIALDKLAIKKNSDKKSQLKFIKHNYIS